jgi:gamma-glutamyltranspeptidase/glutathione hydrolase
MSFGLMGGTMQAQGHTQLMVRIADYGQHPQSAIDGPRFCVINGLEVNIEREFPAATLEALTRRGHDLVKLPEGYMDFGCAQIALKVDGGYVGASDPRRDSLAVGF